MTLLKLMSCFTGLLAALAPAASFAQTSSANAAALKASHICHTNSATFTFYRSVDADEFAQKSLGIVKSADGQTYPVEYSYVPWVCENAKFTIGTTQFVFQTCVSDFRDHALQASLLVNGRVTPVLCESIK